MDWIWQCDGILPADFLVPFTRRSKRIKSIGDNVRGLLEVLVGYFFQSLFQVRDKSIQRVSLDDYAREVPRR